MRHDHRKYPLPDQPKPKQRHEPVTVSPLPPSSSVLPIERSQHPHLLDEQPHGATVRSHFSIKAIDEQQSRFWHGSWQTNRQRVYVAMLASNLQPARVERFRNCGAMPRLWTDEHELRIQAQFCRDRWCETCQKRAVSQARDALMKAFVPGDTRHIMLTLKHNAAPLKAQIKRIRRAFQELRRSDLWKRNVTGSATFVENKLNALNEWHPHLHIIQVGRWIDQRELSKLWYEITGDSSYVYIKAIRDGESQIGYITKYVSKACDQSVYRDPRKLCEAIKAMHCIRLMSTSGSWKGIKLRTHDPDPDPGRWKCIGSLADIINGRIPDSGRWLAALIRRWPGLATNIGLIPAPS